MWIHLFLKCVFKILFQIMVEPCTASSLTKNILKNVWFDCLFDGWVESDCLIAGIIWRDTCNAPFFRKGPPCFGKCMVLVIESYV